MLKISALFENKNHVSPHCQYHKTVAPINYLRIHVGSDTPGKGEGGHEDKDEGHDGVASIIIGHDNITSVIDICIDLEHGTSDEHTDSHNDGTENEQKLATPFVDEDQAHNGSK